MKEQKNLTRISLKKSSENLQLLLTDNFINKSKHLCTIIPNQEWVAWILYRIKDTHYEVFDLVPIAKAQGMQFDVDLSTIENNVLQYIIDKYGIEEVGSIETGMVHSHVNISTNPSGLGNNRTIEDLKVSSDDAADLMYKSLNKNEYLSLITNNKNEWSGRCAREVNQEIPSFIVKVEHRNTQGNLVTKNVTVPEKKERFIEYNQCTFINYDKSVFEEDFLSQVDIILKEYTTKVTAQRTVGGRGGGKNPYIGQFYNKSTHSKDLFKNTKIPTFNEDLFSEEDFAEVEIAPLIDNEAHLVEFLLGKKSNQTLEVFFHNQCAINTSFLQQEHGIKKACDFFGVTQNDEMTECLIEEIIEYLNEIKIKDCGFIVEMYQYYLSLMDLATI